MNFCRLPPPAAAAEAHRAGVDLGFSMCCSPATAELLAFLAAAAGPSRILELGTGVGYGTAWLVSGLSPGATLTTVEDNERCLGAARSAVGPDPRVTWVQADAAEWLENRYDDPPFELIFADCWPGKFSHRDRALDLLASGGLCVVDDLLPQPSWTDDHRTEVDRLLADLGACADLRVLTLAYDTGIAMVTRCQELRPSAS